MAAIITARQFDALQGDHARVLTLEDEDQRPVRVLIVPAGDEDAPGAARRTRIVPLVEEDDLQFATWEDAEWQ